jgi:thiol-disulfide isomerase/thioredoxin
VKLGFIAPPGVDSVATEYSGNIPGVSRNLEICLVRALTLATSLALAGLVVVVIALVMMRPGNVSRPVAPPVAPAMTVGSPGATQDTRASAAPGRRPLSVDEALRELDLIKPPRARGVEDFALPTPGGTTFRLSAHRGKVVFINFWATWCPPCREEMPSMERLYTRLKDRRFAMVAVSLDASLPAVTSYLAQAGFTFPVALDPKMDVANSYGVRALPASLIVDPRGVLVAMAVGPRSWDGPAAQALMEGVAR